MTDEHADLLHARRAARESERAAARITEFAERMSPVVDPAETVEYDTLIAAEASALSTRVEAFERLGLGAPSLDATGPDDA